MKRSPVLVFVVLTLLLTGCLSGTGGFGNIFITSGSLQAPESSWTGKTRV